MEASAGRGIYEALVSRRRALITATMVAVFALYLANTVMFTRWGAADAFQTFLDPDSAESSLRALVWGYRVPESCFALLAGVALGMAGAEMQTILNNPLAEPYTLGISMAAAFGASLVIGAGVGAGVFGEYSTVVMAFVFAMVACSVIYGVACRSRGRITIILMGVAMLFLFQALVNAVQSMVGAQASNSITFWMFGSVSRYAGDAGMEYAAVMAVVVVLVGVLFASNLWKLSALKLGDAKVYSLGIDASKLRRNMIVGISVVTAVTVSFTGTIGFVGLVGPHVARILVGDDQRYLLPMSALCGALFLLASAVLLKALDLALPIGVVTSLVGVPFFIYLILSKRGVSA